MYPKKQHLKTVYISLMFVIALITLGLPSNQAFADTPITQNMPAKVKQQLQQKAYPNWVNNAAAGTPYTALEFFHLPLTQQLAYVKTLHPEIDPRQVTDSYLGTTVADTTNQLTTTTEAAPATTNFSNRLMLARATSFAFAAPAASTTYNSYIDLAPAYMSGGAAKIAVPMYAGTTSDTTQDYLNIGNLSPATVARATVTPVNGDLSYLTDYTYAFDSDNLIITLTDTGLQKLINSGDKCYQGNRFTLNLNSNGTTLAATFNIWLPQIDRAHATLNNNTDLELRFGYGSPLADSQPTQTNQLNGDTYFLDVPNFNIVDKSAKAIEAYKNDEANKDTINGVGASGNEGVRVYVLFSDTVYTNSFQNIPNMGESKLTTADELVNVIENTTPLLFGNKDSRNETKNQWYLGYFDTYKHIHMYPDANDPNLICLDYDGYLKDTAALDAIYPNTFNKVTDPLHLSVQSTLAATNNNQSMAMNEIVTNRSSHDLPGLFFFRGYDTAMGIGPAYYTSSWLPHRYDYVPIYFGAKATTGVRAGNVQGLYLRPPNSSQLNYTLDFNFNTPDAPDSWSGLKYNVIGRPMGSTDFFISSDLIEPSDENDRSKPIFNTPAGKAHAGWPYSKDNIKDSKTTTENKIAFGSETATPNDEEMDSSIIMKWSPAQVGTLAVDKSYDMSYDVSANTASAPRLSMTESYLRVKDNTTKISGTVSDLDSRYVSIYYTIDPDQAVTPGDSLPNSQSNLLTTVDLGAVEENVNHNQYVPFESNLSEETAATLAQYQATGHHLYFYAVDNVNAKGGIADRSIKGYVSNIEDVRANMPVHVTVNGIQTGGSAPTTVTKQLVGYAGDTYNLYDAAKSQGSIFEPEAASLIPDQAEPLYTDTEGYAPQTLQQGSDLYTLDTTQLPTEASGKFELDQNDLTLDYHYTYSGSLTMTAPDVLNFGKHPQTLDNGKYHLQSTSGNNLKVTDSTENKAYELQVFETKPLTMADQTLDHGLGYQVNTTNFIDLGGLEAPATVYKNTTADVANISDTWQQDTTYIAGPVMTINDANRHQIEAGHYSGLLTWTVVKSL